MKWDDFMLLFENSIKISGVKMTDAQRENMKILLLKETNVYVNPRDFLRFLDLIWSKKEKFLEVDVLFQFN